MAGHQSISTASSLASSPGESTDPDELNAVLYIGSDLHIFADSKKEKKLLEYVYPFSCWNDDLIILQDKMQMFLLVDDFSVCEYGIHPLGYNYVSICFSVLLY